MSALTGFSFVRYWRAHPPAFIEKHGTQLEARFDDDMAVTLWTGSAKGGTFYVGVSYDLRGEQRGDSPERRRERQQAAAEAYVGGRNVRLTWMPLEGTRYALESDRIAHVVIDPPRLPRKRGAKQQ